MLTRRLLPVLLLVSTVACSSPPGGVRDDSFPPPGSERVVVPVVEVPEGYVSSTAQELGLDSSLSLVTEAGDVLVVELSSEPEAAAAIGGMPRGETEDVPGTHQLLALLLTRTGTTTEQALLDAGPDGSVLASIRVRSGDDDVQLNARVGDAIAIALLHHAPIVISDRLVARAQSATSNGPLPTSLDPEDGSGASPIGSENSDSGSEASPGRP